MTDAAPDYVYTIYIAAAPEQVWRAIVDGDLTRRYWGHENRSDWLPGSRWEHVRAGSSGQVDICGRVLEIDPPRRLVTSWALPRDEGDAAKTSHVTYEIEPIGAESRLTVTHSDLLDPDMRRGVSSGWPMVLSSLKSFLEAGDGLEMIRARMRELETET